MKIKNKSFFTEEEIREVVRFVKPQNVSRFSVKVRECRGGYSGWFCHSWGNNGRMEPEVIASVSRSISFPHHRKMHGAYLSFDLYNLKEILVMLLAHELRHFWQFKIPKGWRVWRAKGQYSERDADAYALHKVREWRRR